MFKASRLVTPALVLASTLVASSPAGRISAAPVHASTITLNIYFHTQDGVHGVNYEKNDVIAPFEAKYPAIHVNATWMAGPRDTINQQLAAGDYVSNWSYIMAGGLITIGPMVVLYLTLQRRFIEGLTEGGLKG